MIDQIAQLFTTNAWWSDTAYITVFYIVAWIIHHLARHIARGVVRLSHLSPKKHQPRPERRETLRSVIASTVSFIAFTAATLLYRQNHTENLGSRPGPCSTDA